MKLSTLLNRRLLKNKPDNLVSYALQYENGAIRYHTNDVCFARATRHQYWDKGEYEGQPAEKHHDVTAVAVSLINAKEFGMKSRKPLVKLPVFHRYTKYILNESIFKDVFLTKNNSVAWANGVEINVDANYSLCVAGMIALRECWEFPHYLKNWDTMTKMGFNPDFAYIVARMYSEEGDMVSKVSHGGHQTIDLLTMESAKKLLKEGPNLTGLPFRKAHGRYTIYLTMRSDCSYNGDKVQREDCISQKIFPQNIVDEKAVGWAKVKYAQKNAFYKNLKVIEKEVLA